jgi:hypothetical protein
MSPRRIDRPLHKIAPRRQNAGRTLPDGRSGGIERDDNETPRVIFQNVLAMLTKPRLAVASRTAFCQLQRPAPP